MGRKELRLQPQLLVPVANPVPILDGVANLEEGSVEPAVRPEERLVVAVVVEVEVVVEVVVAGHLKQHRGCERVIAASLVSPRRRDDSW